MISGSGQWITIGEVTTEEKRNPWAPWPSYVMEIYLANVLKSIVKTEEKMMKKEIEGMKELDGSIAKWEDIVTGKGADKGCDNCPLCQKFKLPRSRCGNCLIAEDSGDSCCRNTPYEGWASLAEVTFGPNEVTSFPRKADTTEKVKAALAMLDYLKDLKKRLEEKANRKPIVLEHVLGDKYRIASMDERDRNKDILFGDAVELIESSGGIRIASCAYPAWAPSNDLPTLYVWGSFRSSIYHDGHSFIIPAEDISKVYDAIDEYNGTKADRSRKAEKVVAPEMGVSPEKLKVGDYFTILRWAKGTCSWASEGYRDHSWTDGEIWKVTSCVYADRFEADHCDGSKNPRWMFKLSELESVTVLCSRGIMNLKKQDHSEAMKKAGDKLVDALRNSVDNALQAWKAANQ